MRRATLLQGLGVLLLTVGAGALALWLGLVVFGLLVLAAGVADELRQAEQTTGGE